jgi:hypothetical protein
MKALVVISERSVICLSFRSQVGAKWRKISPEQLTILRFHCFEGIGTGELQGLQGNIVKLAGVNDKTRARSEKLTVLPGFRKDLLCSAPDYLLIVPAARFFNTTLLVDDKTLTIG